MSSQIEHVEMSQLLKRAAAMIRDYRNQIGSAGRTPADLQRGDIVFDLVVMANSVDLFPTEKVSAMLLEAGEVIRGAQITLNHKTERGG